MLTINLSKAQQEIGQLDEEMEALLNEAVKFLSPRGGLIDGNKQAEMVTLEQLVEIEPRVALFCLRWLMIDNPAEFCRELANDMVIEAVRQHTEAIGPDTAQTLRRGNFVFRTKEQQIESFSSLREWANCYVGDHAENPIGYAVDVARASIASLDFDSITDPNELVLDAPLRVFKAWVDLAIAASPVMLSAGRMLDAGIGAEKQWREGTELKFDFGGKVMDEAYWGIWNAISARIEAETGSYVKHVITELAAG